MSAYNHAKRQVAHNPHELVQFRVTRDIADALHHLARAEQRTRSSFLAKLAADVVAASRASAEATAAEAAPAATPTIHHFTR